MKKCSTCSETKLLTDFPAGKRKDGSIYYRPHCYSCKYDKETLAGRKIDKEYLRSYYYKNKLDYKIKAYRHNDKIRFPECETVEKYRAIELMKQPCYYCGKKEALGLDRIDSTQGHSEDNIVPCCEKCNNILGDLPEKAKDLLIDGLHEINNQGLLDQWTIPTKRKTRTTS
jgi:hypothetical protein